MKTTMARVCLLVASGWVAVCGLLACSGDDNTFLPQTDAGQQGGGDATADAPADANGEVTPDGGSGADADAAADAPADGAASRLLLSYNNSSTSELVALNTQTKQIDGRLTYAGFIGTTSAQGADPYLLEQAADIVARLDRAHPWTIDSSWNVALADRLEGGSPYSDPDAIEVSLPSKAYVLRYTRNEIAVIDPTQVVDGGAPAGTLDLSSLLQAADTDGIVEMTAGVYVPSRNLAYLVLGNIDRNLVANDGFTLLCASTVSTVIAVDVTTGTLVNLGGTGPGGALVLSGYDPIFGGVAYDAAADRLLVFESGCNDAPANPDAGVGPLVKRQVEALSLFSGQTELLYDATNDGFPSQFVYLDAHRAVLGFDFTGAETRLWDPTQNALGRTLSSAPDLFVYDAAGNLLGPRMSFADGGTSVDVVSVRIADGQSTTLASNPFTKPGGFISGVDVWPHP